MAANGVDIDKYRSKLLEELIGVGHKLSESLEAPGVSLAAEADATRRGVPLHVVRHEEEEVVLLCEEVMELREGVARVLRGDGSATL